MKISKSYSIFGSDGSVSDPGYFIPVEKIIATQQAEIEKLKQGIGLQAWGMGATVGVKAGEEAVQFAEHTLTGPGEFDGIEYTVPVDGVYQINAGIAWGDSSFTRTAASVQLHVNGSVEAPGTYMINNDYSGAYYPSQSLSKAPRLKKATRLKSSPLTTTPIS